MLVLGRYHYAEAHASLGFHCHGKMLEICYLESGEQTYCVGDDEYRLHGGDLFVTYPNEHHGSGKSPEGKGVLYWMLIRVPERNGCLLSLGLSESRVIYERLLHLPARQFPGSPRMGRVLRRVMEVFDRGEDPLHVVNLRNLLLRFLLDVLEASRHSRQEVSEAIRAVQAVIAENLDERLPVARLARAAHLSQSRFKARFKDEVGIPPADYAMRQRVERAKHLLRHGGIPIIEVALQLGFSSTQYFATAFKRYTGETPSEYRRTDE